MKKQIMLLAILAVMTVKTNATVRTVSNDPAGGAQYADLQTAYTAAVNGDTLMLEGTNSNYYYNNGPIIPWGKQLVVIGIGYNPTKSNARKTLIGGSSNGVFYVGASGNGSVFYGIDFVGGISTGTATVANYLFEDCIIEQNFYMVNMTSLSNFTFRNCVFSGTSSNFVNAGSGQLFSNVSFFNCIFNSTIALFNQAVSGVTVDHCMFLTTGSPLNGCRNSIFSNCIFENSGTITGSTGYDNVFTNNIYRVYGSQIPPAQSGFSNTGSGNLPATAPSFVSYTLNSLYAASHNYHFNSGSPGTGAATDATDIGLHGGTAHYSETGEVLINPIVRSLTIGNINVAPNGNLNVTISASKPNDQ